MDSPHVHVLTMLDPVLTVLPMNAHLKNHIVVTRKFSYRRGAVS